MKFILRHIWNNRLYAAIKIGGLAIGMTCMLLAILFVQDENNYDTFHKNASRLYRLTTVVNDGQEKKILGSTGQVQGPAFKAGIPEIQESVRLWPDLVMNFIVDGKGVPINMTYADPAFFTMFSFPFIQGNPATSLQELHAAVLTEKTAMRIFGTTDVVGKTLQLEEGNGINTLMITGVTKNVPEHSSLQFEAVLPFAYLQTMFDDKTWLNPYLSTFVLLHPQADPNKVQGKFSSIYEVQARKELKEANMPASRFQFGLQPITDVHLNKFDTNFSAVNGSGGLAKQSLGIYSYLLMGIAAFILVMAAVNFLNLSVAGSLKRSKEIGVRKILGGTSGHILIQFLGESAVLCGIAYILAVLFAVLSLPLFNRLAQTYIHLSWATAGTFLLYGLLLIAACIVLVGLYPAIKLTLFNAIEVLYNKQKRSSKSIFARSLIVLQFTFAIGLILASIIYYRQMHFIANKDLGYTPTDVIKLGLPGQRAKPHYLQSFRNQLTNEPSVKEVASGSMYAGQDGKVKINGNELQVGRFSIDEFFVPALQISVKEGRNFSSLFKTDSANAVLVNETLVKAAGWSNPIGMSLMMEGEAPKTIIGVIKDFHYGTLKENIHPQVLEIRNSEDVYVKVQHGKTPEALAALEKAYKKTFPDHFYKYRFLEDEVNGQYAGEQRWKQIISYASALAIVICCIGLFGLAHFATVRRTKEIGIRKVLGASTAYISKLLTADFLKLVFLSVIIASPVAGYIMNGWLENFSYRIQISWIDFAIAGVIALLIALITVTTQAYKAALANPVNSLRTE